MVTILPPRENLNHHWLLLELHAPASSPTAWTTIACATLRSICGMSGVMPTCPFSSMLPARTGSSTVPTSVRSSSPRAPMYMSNGSFPTSVMLRPSLVGSLQRLVWLQVSHRKNAVPMLGSIPLMIHSWTWSHIWSLIAVVLEMSNQLVDIVESSIVAVSYVTVSL